MQALTYRVCKYVRSGKKLVLAGIFYKGYFLTCSGELFRGQKLLNTKDRRRTQYFLVEKQACFDVYGEAVYCNDVVYDTAGRFVGLVKYSFAHSAFILRSYNNDYEVDSALLCRTNLIRLWRM